MMRDDAGLAVGDAAGFTLVVRLTQTWQGSVSQLKCGPWVVITSGGSRIT